MCGTEMATVSASYLKCYFDTCVTLGTPASKLLEYIPGKANNLNDPAARFSVEIVYDILKLALKTTNNPTIGLEAGQHFRPGTHGEAGQGLMACPTLRDGSEFLSRYEGLMQQYGSTHVTTDDNYTWVHWDTVEKDANIDLILTDASIVHHIQYLRWLAQNNDMVIRLVHLRRPEPDNPAEYEKVFGCTSMFGQVRDAIALDREMIDTPLPQGNKKLLGGMCKKLDVSLKKLATPLSATEMTIRSLKNLMPKGKVDLPTIAADLSIKDRNLRRLLKEEGTSFRILLEKIRREKCETLLLHEQVPLSQIADRLCYSEQSAFTRAFKKWYGQTPKAYAQSIQAGAK
jgi:AraC-like DNA-binding protein